MASNLIDDTLGLKAYFAFGESSDGSAVLVQCDTLDDAVLEKERLKRMRNPRRVSYTSRPVAIAEMKRKAVAIFSNLTIRKFKESVK